MWQGAGLQERQNRHGNCVFGWMRAAVLGWFQCRPVASWECIPGDYSSMQLKTTAFCEGGVIPARYTCEGKNCSPPLAWEQPPQNTQSLALIVDDPDAPAGTWVHWVVYDLTPATTHLAEDVPKTQYIPAGAMQGLNDFRHLGYGGPCPPPGPSHRYFFRLHALDCALKLKPGLTRKELDHAMSGHVLEQVQLMGTYQR
jgi:Raf kinase inhibitor-like YbhB/YbcL family protein